MSKKSIFLMTLYLVSFVSIAARSESDEYFKEIDLKKEKKLLQDFNLKIVELNHLSKEQQEEFCWGGAAEGVHEKSRLAINFYGPFCQATHSDAKKICKEVMKTDIPSVKDYAEFAKNFGFKYEFSKFRGIDSEDERVVFEIFDRDVAGQISDLFVTIDKEGNWLAEFYMDPSEYRGSNTPFAKPFDDMDKYFARHWYLTATPHSFWASDSSGKSEAVTFGHNKSWFGRSKAEEVQGVLCFNSMKESKEK